MIPFEVFEHTADIGLRSYGRTLEEAFENAARGMFSLMADLNTVEATEEVKVRVEADDPGSLLVAWLNELLYLFDAKKILLSKFTIQEWDKKSCLLALAYGERIDPKKHQLEMDIKACTYHMLKITKNDLYACQVVLDV